MEQQQRTSTYQIRHGSASRHKLEHLMVVPQEPDLRAGVLAVATPLVSLAAIF